MNSVEGSVDRQPVGGSSSSRVRGALRFLVVAPVAFLASACITPQASLDEVRKFQGCVVDETFTKGGGVGIGARIPERHVLIIDIQGLGQIRYSSTEQKAIENDAIYDPGDRVTYDVTRTEIYVRDDQESEKKARERARINLDSFFRGQTVRDSRGRTEISLALIKKGDCI